MRVLVVEDHELLARTIGTGLRREGMAVDVVTDGGQALERLDVTPYEVLVLDRDLPTVSGDDVCRWIGERGLPARVLMLNAAGTLADRGHGLELRGGGPGPRPGPQHPPTKAFLLRRPPPPDRAPRPPIRSSPACGAAPRRRGT